MLQVLLMPLLKNKAGSPTDVNNCRAIALSNSLSKVLENVILSCFEMCDQSNDLYQFGFKKDILPPWHVQYLNMLLITIVNEVVLRICLST